MCLGEDVLVRYEVWWGGSVAMNDGVGAKKVSCERGDRGKVLGLIAKRRGGSDAIWGGHNCVPCIGGVNGVREQCVCGGGTVGTSPFMEMVLGIECVEDGVKDGEEVCGKVVGGGGVGARESGKDVLDMRKGEGGLGV